MKEAEAHNANNKGLLVCDEYRNVYKILAIIDGYVALIRSEGHNCSEDAGRVLDIKTFCKEFMFANIKGMSIHAAVVYSSRKKLAVTPSVTQPYKVMFDRNGVANVSATLIASCIIEGSKWYDYKEAMEIRGRTCSVK